MITPDRKQLKFELDDHVIKPAMPLKRRDMKAMSFGSVFRPLYYSSRIWGLAPFSIATNANGEIQKPKIRLCDGLCFLATIYVHLCLMDSVWNKFNTTKEKRQKGTWILLISARAMEIFTFGYGILTVSMNICNRFNLIAIVKMFIRFDREVCLIYVSPCAIFSVSFLE